MTETEEEILDALYFVISFSNLRKQTQMEDSVLKAQLLSLIQKEWVNYFLEIDGEANPPIDLGEKLDTLYYLASKKGLFAHNSR